jgi:hypothetical protein
MLDKVGSFTGRIAGTSFKAEEGKAPTAILSLNVEKYLSEAGEFVPYLGDSINAYVYLFRKDAEIYCKETKLRGYDQAKDALKWDGTSFDPFSDGTFDNLEICFNTKEDTYDGKTSIKVDNIWAIGGAAVGGALPPIDPAAVKAANAKMRFGAPAATAPVAAKRGRPAKAKAEVSENPTQVQATNTAVTAKDVQPTPATPPSRKPAEVSQGCSKIAAWTEVSDPDGNGGHDGPEVEQVWNATIDKVAGASTPDESITPQQWGQIRSQAIAELLVMK